MNAQSLTYQKSLVFVMDEEKPEFETKERFVYIQTSSYAPRIKVLDAFKGLERSYKNSLKHSKT